METNRETLTMEQVNELPFGITRKKEGKLTEIPNLAQFHDVKKIQEKFKLTLYLSFMVPDFYETLPPIKEIQMFRPIHKLFFSFLLLCVCSLFGLISNLLAASPELVQEVMEGKRDTARASWWGFSPDDSTEFLQAAINSGVKTLIIDKQNSEWITRRLFCVSNQEIILEEGTVILAKKGEFKGTADSLFTISLCENVTIRGEKQDAGKSAVLRMRKADYHTQDYVQAEWRHGLNIKSSKNILVQDLKIEFTGGDGIYLGVSKKGVPCRDIVIRRVDCNENNRQGISVISAENLLIEDTVMRNTNGTAPQAGIDFEPNGDSELLKNCVMRNCLCEGNAGDGYEFYLPNLTERSEDFSFVIENCVSKNNRRNGFNFMTGTKLGSDFKSAKGTLILKNFRSEKDGGGLVFRGVMNDFHRVSLENVEFIDPGINAERKAPAIRFMASADELASLGGISFKNVSLRLPKGVMAINQTANSSFANGMVNVKGEINVIHDDGTTEKIVIDDAWLARYFPVKNTKKLPVLPLETKSLVPLAPQNLESDSNLQNVPPVRLRNKLNIHFYVKKGQKPKFAIQYFQVGRPAITDMPLIWTTPSGKNLKAGSLAPKQTTEIELPAAEETGIYVLSAAQKTSHGFRLVKSNLPFAYCAKSLELIGSSSTFHFYVPKGTEMFGVRINGDDGERVKIEILNPAGNVCFAKDDIGGSEFFYPEESEAMAGGIWTIRTGKPSNAVFEDFYLSLQNITPILVTSPDMILRNE
ncbi:MAG: hypothetical protein E7028_06350 [Planctomycetaceae bacterium]|nr:hypothetical protein [Planctomycetaceae bacterium]